MSLLLTHHYRLNLTRRQHAIMASILEQQRQLYNGALEERISCYERTGRSISNAAQARSLTQIRKHDPGFAAVPRRVQRWTLNLVETAYKGMFTRVKNGEPLARPRFRSRGDWRTFGVDSPIEMKWDGKRLRLNATHSLGGLRVHKAHTMPAWETVKGVTFSRRVRVWSVQLTFEQTERMPAASPRKPVGVDVGSITLATTSDGQRLGDYRARDAACEAALRWSYRALSRCRRGSKRRRKVKARLARTHQRITNRRNNLLEKTSAELVRQFDGVAVEDLNVKWLVQSGPGGVYGRGIRRADRAWGLLRRKIEWKCQRVGRAFKAVPPDGTSQECSACGAIVRKELSERVHRCEACGTVLDRDVNAARNVLRRAGWGPGRVNAGHRPERRTGNTAVSDRPDHVGLSPISSAKAGSVLVASERAGCPWGPPSCCALVRG
jgi:putative transposase